MRAPFIGLVAVAALIASTPASALDLCRTTVLQNVRALEDKSSVMRKGETATSVTQYRTEKNGSGSFCSHGGYCYPAAVRIGGKNVVAQKLVNCTIDRSTAETDNDGETIYYLKVDRSRNSAHDLRLYDVASRLLNLGASEAGSSNMAEAFVDRPKSTCGGLTARILAGDRRLRARLMNGDIDC